jgi:hypothetical protein
MGPFLLLDKSFLRAINPAEARALQKHYSLLISPLLLEEMISALSDNDLEEPDRLREVHSLVSKANGITVFKLHDARAMLQADLNGAKIPLRTQIPRFGGKHVYAPDGSRGVILEETFEDQLLRNWSVGDFSQKDREVAGKLKRDVAAYDLPGSQKRMQEQFPENTRANNILEIAQSLDANEHILGGRWESIECLARWALLDERAIQSVKDKWESAGKPSLRDWAPYSHFCNRVFGIYFLAVTAGLVPVGKKDKSLIDFMYFFYLPFSHAFVSGDKFHRDMFQYFGRPEQEFIWGPDLKKDLNQIASFHASLSPDDALAFEREFGSYPPPIPGSLTRDLWIRQMRPWTPGSGNRAIGMSPERQKELIDEIKKRTGMT